MRVRLKTHSASGALVFAVGFLVGACSTSESPFGSSNTPPNILLIVADDLNWDSVGVYGSPLSEVTPHIDRLATQGMRFEWAHVNVSVCMPSRHVMLSGRYSHRSGGEGFQDLRVPGVPLLPDLLRGGGYRVGALGKLKHSTPYKDFAWDLAVDRTELGMGRSPGLFAEHALAFIEEAQAERAPFFLMANSHDPHRPFHGLDSQEWYDRGERSASLPTKSWNQGDCPIPGFLPQLVKVGTEVAAYYRSARRCDDTVGALLDVLDQTGVAGDTVVVFLSDNGMAFPFAKAACYLHSTRTPWIVRWPEHIEAGAVCSEEMISAVDLMPTLLELAGVGAPQGLDGRTLVPLLEGRPQPDRDFVFTQYAVTAEGRSFPMRCVQNRRYGYIFNLWADGERQFARSEHKINGTFQVMRSASERNEQVAARTEFLLRRCPEELYDFERDPNGLTNLVEDPAHRKQLELLRGELESWMIQFEDPALAAYRSRGSGEERERFMAEQERDFSH